MQEIDVNKDGWVFPKDFKEKMEQQKSYTPLVKHLSVLHFACIMQNFTLIFMILSIREEIEFLLQCCERNHDGKIDYAGFTDRFHEPAKEIGFNLAVLLTNLSEHMPNEPRYILCFHNKA